MIAAEEAKRRRCVDPEEYWRATAEALNWAEAQSPIPRNFKEGCLAAQRRLLEWLGEPNGPMSNE